MVNPVVMSVPGANVEPESPANLAGSCLCMEDQYVIPSGPMGTDYGMPEFSGGMGSQGGMDNAMGGMFMMFGMIMQGLMLMLGMVTTMLQLKNSMGGQAVTQTDTGKHGNDTGPAGDGTGETVEDHANTEDTDTDNDNDTVHHRGSHRSGGSDEPESSGDGGGDDDVALDDPRVTSVRDERGEATERTANWGALH